MKKILLCLCAVLILQPSLSFSKTVTAGIFTFVIEDNADNTYAGKIEITDIQGKIIKSSVVETQNSLLDITDLEAGIYFYKFYPSNSSKISIGKILKQ